MTKLLTQAFSEAERLPEVDQDSLAEWLLHELEAERQWHRQLAERPDVLDSLADEALAEHRAGRCSPLDPDRL